ncbi:anti-anti-sigma factor [Mycobacterium sp. BK086]|uniref:STAS domain-containing protein n=1 Tax=Mycobacterium sp. BK086 TaxID=2512165 RepID=UPI0010ECD3B3|nr:STAS domain-containing protein [Mycobacterium sp. BK086]TDO18262.1 anti-anti-sigma factor [Mycobacterium sp. BK086]
MPPSISDSTTVALHLSTEWHNATDVWITAIGHVDMSTADDFSDYVFRRAGNCQHLTLDMTKVTFFDCAGFSALYLIAERCHTAHVTWAVHPAHCVSRVVTMCDPLKELPLSTTGEFDSFCA